MPSPVARRTESTIVPRHPGPAALGAATPPVAREQRSRYHDGSGRAPRAAHRHRFRLRHLQWEPWHERGQYVNGDTQRRQLGEFLKSRRSRLVRGQLGLPPVGGRDRGLRREEVAVLSGVSITWYTWLEQGRDTQPSRQVLDAIARTLRLTEAEQAYLLSLAGYSVPAPSACEVVRSASAQVQPLLDGMGDLLAYVVGPDWQVVGWTSAFEAVYPTFATAEQAERNALWLFFTDPLVRETWSDWEAAARGFLAEFRADAAQHLSDPSLSALVQRLLDSSPAFRSAWERHDVGGHPCRKVVIHHRTGGDLFLKRHRLRFSDLPGLHMVVYTPVASTGTTARLRRLIESAAARENEPPSTER
jgi:transcriptional regulator with XRE-family HTH domain